MTENEFLLVDRIQKIRQIVNKYGEDNFYIAFSGGKDSTVLSALLDMACPGNKIPRVYANTGIEYRLIYEFVEHEKSKNHPWELIILKPTIPIKTMLENDGYPFKSKKHSKNVSIYQKYGKTQSIKVYLGETTTSNKKEIEPLAFQCPKKLRYQFENEWKDIKISDKCCFRLKEEPMKRFSIEYNKPYAIIGIMASEGGRRSRAKCLAFNGNKLKAFQPLTTLNKKWEDWFILKYNIEISDLYKSPYNFERTGCKGCPFALHLQKELNTLERFFPAERKQCEIIWKPVYQEYKRLHYRLEPYQQISIEDYLEMMESGCKP